MTRHVALGSVFLLVLTGCAAKHGAVSMEPVPIDSSGSGGRGYDSQRSHVLPFPVQQAPPIYPDEGLPEKIACEVELLYHVLKDGTAKCVRFTWVEPPEAHLDAFEKSIRAAVGEWEFHPGKIISWKEQPDGTTKTTVQTVPKGQKMLFRFRVVAGKGVVE